MGVVGDQRAVDRHLDPSFALSERPAEQIAMACLSIIQAGMIDESSRRFGTRRRAKYSGEPMTSVEDDVAAVHRSLDAQDGPVLLVAHSYGGVVITEAGIDPDVKGLVYLTAFQPDIGQSGGGLLASVPSDFTADKLTVTDDGFQMARIDAFLSLSGNGLSEEDALFVARSQAWTSAENLAHEVTSVAWLYKLSWTAVATEDLLILPELQRCMAERAGSTVVEIKNGHMLPMTNPDEVAEVIARAAQAVN